jgi:hypothetical protein
MEHLVPVCHATSKPMGGSSKLESRTTLIHAHSTTPEIVAPSLYSVTHPERYVWCWLLRCWLVGVAEVLEHNVECSEEGVLRKMG